MKRLHRIDAVVFDWGGVLIDDPAPEMIRYISGKLNIPVTDGLKAYSKTAHDFGCGKISEKQVWQRVCQELAISEPAVNSLWLDAFKAAYVENRKVIELAENIKRSGIKTGLLSNTEPPVADYFHNLSYEMIDESVFSCREGIMKPEKELYRAICKRLNVNEGETIFIDDKKEFVAGAIESGMIGILYENEHQLYADLIKCALNADN